jgi:hypothetical protein
MPSGSTNMQLFALRQSPPERLEVLGRGYRLAKVFKHDFVAATTLYEAVVPGDGPDRLVVKFGREHGFCGIPGAWLGRLLARRERRFHQLADGVPGIQRWVRQISPTACALEYIDGDTLDRVDSSPDGAFFDMLRRTLDLLHGRGIAYCDLNKLSNIVIAPDGRPGLIDFQIAVWDDDRANPLVRRYLRSLVAYLQGMDLYHLYKHKRRLAPDAMTDTQQELATRRGRLIRLHRRLVTPLRRLRRGFLTRQHRKGTLVSPTAAMEDHYQPEKATWRK